MQKEIASLHDLETFLLSLPEGTESNLIPDDLDAGNFSQATLFLPDDRRIELTYTGPEREGYISPFAQTERYL